MKIKRRIVKVIETEKIARCLLYMVIITVILDTITTLYALGIGLSEVNIIAFSFMQYFGIAGLIILGASKIIFFIVAYLYVKKESSKLRINNRKNLTYLTLLLILLISLISTSLTVINNLSQICQKLV